MFLIKLSKWTYENITKYRYWMDSSKVILKNQWRLKGSLSQCKIIISPSNLVLLFNGLFKDFRVLGPNKSKTWGKGMSYLGNDFV